MLYSLNNSGLTPVPVEGTLYIDRDVEEGTVKWRFDREHSGDIMGHGTLFLDVREVSQVKKFEFFTVAELTHYLLGRLQREYHVRGLVTVNFQEIK